MAPTLVCEGGRPTLAIGAAGGRTILSNLCHAIVRLIDRGEPLEILNSGDRFHVETAERVRVEETGAALAEGLRRRGHQVQLRPRFGALQAIRCGPEPGVLRGVADSRRAGMVLWA
jgi:gamma-glutamyltranspeptidase/glutathione hydrolase